MTEDKRSSGGTLGKGLRLLVALEDHHEGANQIQCGVLARQLLG